MAQQLSAVSKTVSSATVSGVLTVDSTSVLRVGQIGWLSKSGVVSRRVEITAVMSPTTVRATMMPLTSDDNFGRGNPMAYPTTDFLDLSAFDGGATFNAEAQVVSDTYTIPNGSGNLIDGVYGGITISSNGLILRVTDGNYGDVTVSGGGTIWSVSDASEVADWPITTTRYYAVDYVNGNDTNTGYSDVSMAAAGAVALKTLTRWRQVVPILGNGRGFVLAVAGTATGADLQYYKPDGVTLDDLDFRGLEGYGRYIARTTTNFVNDTADKRNCAPAFGQAGPNGDSSWTVLAGATTSSLTIAAGALTAEPGLSGMRVRFTGNVTAALAGQCRMIWFNDGTTIVPGRNFSVAPAAGDTFYVERPGVSVNEIFVDQKGSGDAITLNNVSGVQVVGFRARQTTPRYFNLNTAGSLGLCFNEFDAHISGGFLNFFSQSQAWVDEAGTQVISGTGARFSHDSFVLTIGSNLFQFDDFACISVPAFYSLAIQNCVSFTLGAGSVSYANVQLSSCGRPGATGGNNDIGAHSGTSIRTLRRPNSPGSSSPIQLISTHARISADISNAGSQTCIKLLNLVGGSLKLNGLASRDGGNTGYAVDVSTCRNLAITVAGTNTLSPSTGEMLMAGSFATTWAQLALAEVHDSAGNTAGSATAVGVMRKTTGSIGLVPLLSADPSVLYSGDLWARDDNRLALRGTDAITRYAWFTETPLIALWSTTTTRYWFVDYDAGSDTNIGYIDATEGSTFTSLQTAPVALKTLERLTQLLPRFGNGRKVVVLIKSRALGSKYRNIANTADDILDLRGHAGYEYEIYRGSTDLTNSTTDRVFCGGVQNPVGPDAGGAYTISSVTDVFTFGISTTPWVANTLNGRRVRFAADASAPYANQCISIQTNSTGGIVLMERISATLPLVGDKFYIETPGVQVSKIVNGEIPIAYRTTAANSANSRRVVVGISFDAATLAAFQPDSAHYAFIEQSASIGTYVTFVSSNTLATVLNLNRSYPDETGTNRTAGSSIFNAQVSLSVFSIVIQGNAFNNTGVAPLITASKGTIASSGTYFARAPTLTGCGWTPGVSGASVGATSVTRFGSVSLTTQRRVVVASNILDAAYCNVQFEAIEFLSTAATPYIRFTGQGCNVAVDSCVGTGGTDVCIDATKLFDSSLVCDRQLANTMTASLGAIRTNGGSIISTFVSLAGKTVIDQARNRICGTGALTVENRTSLQLAADPLLPAIGDTWARDDNRLALRGSDAVTRYAWFGDAPVMPSWANTAPRYYAVDYINGVDTNRGYSDVDAATAGTVAIKTLTQLRKIVPLFGNGRDIVILVAGDPAGADLQYLKPDGVTLDDLDLRLIGYRVVLVRSTRAFTNTTADKIILGAAIGSTGPDIGGVWTCTAGSTTSVIQVASATLPTEPSATGMRVRFTGNVTAALANKTAIIWKNTAGVITVGVNLSNTPANGDTFYIERAGVSVNNINITCLAGAGMNTGQIQFPTSIVGFRARQTDASPAVYNWSCHDLRLNFCEFDQFLSMRAMNFIQIDQQYVDEGGTTQTTGVGVRHAQNKAVLLNGATFLTYNHSAIYSASTPYNISRCAAYVIGRGCYFAGRLGLIFCGTGATSSSAVSLFGADGSGQNARLIGPGSGSTNAVFTLTSTNGRISGVDISNAGASPAVTVASFSAGYLSFRTMVSTDGGNTDVGISFGTSGQVNASAATAEFATSCTLTGTLGDIRMGDGGITSYAAVQNTRYIDAYGNRFGGILGTDQTLTRKTPGIIYNIPLGAADPTSPIIADLWGRSDNRLALRGSDAITRYAQFTRVPAIAEWDTANTRYVAVDPVAGDDTRIGYIDAAHGTSWASSATLDAVSVKTLEEVFQRIVPLNGNKRSLVILIKGNAAAVTAIDVLNKAGTALDCIDVRGVVPYSYSYFSVRASNFLNDAADLGAGARMIAYAGPNGDSSWTVSSYSAPVLTLSAGALATGSELAGLALRFKGNITAALANRVNACKYAPTSGTLEYGGSAATFPVLNDEFFIEKPSLRMAMWKGNISTVSRTKRATITDSYAPWLSSLTLVLPTTTGATGYATPHHMASVSACVFDCLTNATAMSAYVDLANMFSTRVSEATADISVFNAFRIEASQTSVFYNMGAATRLNLSQVQFFGATSAVQFTGGTQLSISSAYVHGIVQITNTQGEGSWPNFPSIGATTATGRVICRAGTSGIQFRNVKGAHVRFVSFIDVAGNAIDVVGDGSTIDIGDCTSTNVTGYGLGLTGTTNTKIVLQNTTLPSGTSGDITTAGGLATYAQMSYMGFKDHLGNSIMNSTTGDESAQGVKCTASGAVALGDTVRITASGVATKAQADTAANATDVFGCAQNAAVNGASFMVVGAGHGLVGFTSSPPTAPGIAYLSEATAGLCNTTAPATAGTNQILRIGKVFRPIAGQPLAVCSIYPEYVPVLA